MHLVKLRAHHLVCLQNFVGKGYSKIFVNNVIEIKQYLLINREIACIEITKGFDDLCFNCPRKSAGFLCEFANMADARYMEFFKIKTYDRVCYGKIIEQTRTNLSKKLFEQICGKCEWFDLCLDVMFKNLKR